jgi:hypothetical protein
MPLVATCATAEALNAEVRDHRLSAVLTFHRTQFSDRTLNRTPKLLKSQDFSRSSYNYFHSIWAERHTRSPRQAPEVLIRDVMPVQRERASLLEPAPLQVRFDFQLGRLLLLLPHSLNRVL